jgi:hypothetical protein
MDAWLARGQVLLQLAEIAPAAKAAQKAARALCDFRVVVKDDSSHAAAHEGMGRCLALMGQLLEATEVANIRYRHYLSHPFLF